VALHLGLVAHVDDVGPFLTYRSLFTVLHPGDDGFAHALGEDAVEEAVAAEATFVASEGLIG
jgi:hypothetical protein